MGEGEKSCQWRLFLFYTLLKPLSKARSAPFYYIYNSKRTISALFLLFLV
jgi:hypothetical protein